MISKLKDKLVESTKLESKVKLLETKYSMDMNQVKAQ